MTSTAPSTKRLESSTPSETAIRWPTTELLLRWARRLLSDGMLWQPRADHEQRQELGDVTITQGLDATRPITEALQLRSRVISESLAQHDSWIMDDGWVGRGDAGAVGVVVAGREGADRAAAHVPHEMTFATKPRLARAMIERAIAAGVPFGWVAGDTIYGVGAH